MKSGKFVRRIARGAVFVLVGLLLISLLATISLYFFRDRIAEKIFQRTNRAISGKLGFESLSFSPLVHFPNLSVKLHAFYVTQHKDSSGTYGNDTIIQIDRLYVSFHLIDLLKGHVNIDRTTARGGKVFLESDQNGQLNFSNAFLRKNPTIPDSTILGAHTESVEKGTISAERIRLRDFQVTYKDRVNQKKIFFYVDGLIADIEYKDRQIVGKLEFDSEARQIEFSPKLNFPPFSMGLKTSFSIGLDSLMVELRSGILEINNAGFELNGTSQFFGIPTIDLRLNGSDNNLSFFRVLLSEKGINQLNVGNTYFSGAIRGRLDMGLPQMEFKFGTEDVSVKIPEMGDGIRDLNFKGTFSSGTAPDLSQALLTISELKGKLPGGYVNAHLMLENFIAPRFNLFWDMEVVLDHLDDLIQAEKFDHLRGRIKFYDNVAGEYDPEKKTISEELSESLIMLDSVSFSFGDLLRIEHLGGVLRRSGDTLTLSDVIFYTANSDFTLNGTVNGLSSLFFGKTDSMQAQLSMVSDTFDLPRFFTFDPRVGERFPYRILNIDGEFQATTTRDQLLEFHSNPEIVFNISRLDATIENLFPPVYIRSGRFHLTEKEERLYLDFKGFDLEMEGSRMKTDVVYFSPENAPDFVHVDLLVNGLEPARTLFLNQDTVPVMAKGNLNAKLIAELELATDTSNFKTIHLDASTLDYHTVKDTFHLEDFRIEAKNVSYTTKDNPLASLTSEIELSTGKVYSNYFQQEDMKYRIEAINGEYFIHPEKIRFFGKEGTGSYRVRPFTDPAEYVISYKVNGFLIEDLLASLMTDTVLLGPMDLNLELSTKKRSGSKLSEALTGHIEISGTDVTLRGIDLDNLITKYNRSQNFNLADVGAVVLAGPVGLALTKGSSYANLAARNFGDQTKITQVISEWECINGRLITKDCAIATEKNRIAAKGWIDLPADSLEVTVAILDKNGCSILSQKVHGSLKKPEYGDIKIVGTVLGPVTNLMEVVLGVDCVVFYTGKIAHPDPKKKNK